MENVRDKSTMYQLMRQSDSMDDDGMDLCDAVHYNDTTDNFVDQYLSFYTDIKRSTRDDW